jgi:hypothetical protein
MLADYITIHGPQSPKALYALLGNGKQITDFVALVQNDKTDAAGNPLYQVTGASRACTAAAISQGISLFKLSSGLYECQTLSRDEAFDHAQTGEKLIADESNQRAQGFMRVAVDAYREYARSHPVPATVPTATVPTATVPTATVPTATVPTATATAAKPKK